MIAEGVAVSGKAGEKRGWRGHLVHGIVAEIAQKNAVLVTVTPECTMN
jgi:hypothetical protein